VLSRVDVRSAQAAFHQPGDPLLVLKLTPDGQRKFFALVTASPRRADDATILFTSSSP
jgi:hypothetical protein